MAAHVAHRSFGEEARAGENQELWDFGALQVVAKICTGDLRHVHGPAAPSQEFGGPVDLHNFQGCAILVAREGDDHAKVVRKLSVLQTIHFETRCGAQPGEVEELVKSCQGGEAFEATCARAQIQYKEKVLMLKCPPHLAGGGGDFAAEWHLYHFGISTTVSLGRCE